MHFTVLLKAICELAAVAHIAPVDEHFDVVTHLALVVEHVVAHPWPRLEVALEELGDGGSRELGGRARRVPGEIGGEVDAGHRRFD